MSDFGGPQHRALVQRTLSVTGADWDAVVERFQASARADAPVEDRLAQLTEAFASVIPPRPARPITGACPLCGARVQPQHDDGVLLFGQCEGCGHGVLLEGAAPPTIYGAEYFQSKREGAGYERYLEERDYRIEKGRRIVQRLIDTHGATPRTLLEVGCGYGFTRSAAETLGLRTTGVDVNPHAAKRCAELFGLETTIGTSRDIGGTFDLVLSQFVLEHVPDVRAEVSNTKRLAAPGGLVCFIVPSMDATERAVFHARYRSYRADHLHLFSRRSIRELLEGAGFVNVQVTSECNLHLLAGFLTPSECSSLYARGAGPDLFITARAPSSRATSQHLLVPSEL